MMIAKGFVENGAKVYVVSRKLEACERVAAALNALGKGSAVALSADLATDAACRELAAKLAEREKKVDVLVNNAGVTWGDSFDAFPEKAWQRTMTLSESRLYRAAHGARQLLTSLPVTTLSQLTQARRPTHSFRRVFYLPPHSSDGAPPASGIQW